VFISTPVRLSLEYPWLCILPGEIKLLRNAVELGS
jgi:hypothetical protein